MKVVKLEDITKNQLSDIGSNLLNVEINQENFYFKINLNEKSNRLLVFSNGAVDATKSKPPIFMRSSWAENFSANCIFIDDKTIHDTGLRIGWGVGTEERHYLKDYIIFVKKIMSILNIKENNTFYYGSSAGGFMSIAMASMHKGTSAIANNPQTHVNRYNVNPVNQLYKTIFPNYERNQILKKFSNRLSLVNIMARNKNVPRVYYLQNRLCKFDIQKHFTPFINSLDRYEINSRNINFILYNNRYSGHSPLSKDETIDYINSIITSDNKPLY